MKNHFNLNEFENINNLILKNYLDLIKVNLLNLSRYNLLKYVY